MKTGKTYWTERRARASQAWFLLIIFLLLSACAKKPETLGEVPLTGGPGDTLFLQAEKEFESRHYDQALESYNDYLSMYPNSPLAPSVLLKVGSIHSAKGELEDAQSAFIRIIEAYPDSPLIRKAQLEMMSVYYRQGQYALVVESAKDLPDAEISSDMQLRKQAILGDTYLALQNYAASAEIYFDLYSQTDDIGKSHLIHQMEIAADHLPLTALENYFNRSDDSRLKAMLLYQRGLRYAQEGRVEDGINALKSFVDMFPDDERTPEARKWLERYAESGQYQHYTIGCLLPLSGKYQTFGMNALKGIELAVGRFAAQYPEIPVRIVVRDTEADPSKSAQLVRNLVEEEKVAAIIGPILEVEAAAAEAQNLKVPIITFSQKKDVAGIGEYVFRHFLTPEMQVEAIADYAVTDLGLRRFAILYPNEKYGETFMRLFWDAVAAKGGVIVGAEAYNGQQSDFAAPIKKLVGLHYKVPMELREKIPSYYGYPAKGNETESAKRNAPRPNVDFEALFIPDGPEKASLILPQLAYYDIYNVRLFGTNLWHSKKLIHMADPYIQGAVFPDIFFADSLNPSVQEFVRQFKQAYGAAPGFLEAVAYDTAMILFDTLRQPNVQFRDTIKDSLINMQEYQGVTGVTRFDESGEARKQLYLLRVRGNSFVEVSAEEKPADGTE